MHLFSLLLVLLLPQLGVSNSCVVGTVITAVDLQGASIVARLSDGKVGESMIVSSKSTFQFKLCNSVSQGQEVDIMCRGVMMDTLYLGTITDTTQNVRLAYPIELHKNLAGHWVCPKCHRADKTVEVVYGDGIPINTNPKARKSAAGCIDNGTRGYCHRDQIKF
jgi:hypothetical protein